MRTYEMMVVIDPSPDMDKIDMVITRIEEMITGKKGKIHFTDRWGRRRLAYEIQHRQYGYYTLFTLEIDPTEINDMNRMLRLNSMVLRHLILVLEPKTAELVLEKLKKVEEESVKKSAEKADAAKPEEADTAKPDEADAAKPEESAAEEIPSPTEEIVEQVEAVPILEVEPLVVEPPPVVEEISVVEEPPATEEPPPAVEEISLTEEPPAVIEPPPAVEEIPLSEEAPAVVEPPPAVEEIPLSEEAPAVVEPPPAVEEIPLTEETPQPVEPPVEDDTKVKQENSEETPKTNSEEDKE